MMLIQQFEFVNTQLWCTCVCVECACAIMSSEWSPTKFHRASHGITSQSMSVLSSHPRHRHTSPLHSASIHITTFADNVNPVPWELSGRDKGGGVSQNYLSPQRLTEITGERDLKKITYLELSINSSDNSLGNFGTYLPNLVQLRLNASNVPCVRDLGTSLSNVKVLWMPRCQLKDLDGLPALSNLRELYLAFNEVEDVSLITMLSYLEVLDLESNNLSELDQLGYLSLCPSLISLNLEGNPLCTLLAEREDNSESSYRNAIKQAIPKLQTLDDSLLAEEGGKHSYKDHGLSSTSSVFALSEAGMGKDLDILQNTIKHGPQLSQVSEVFEPEVPEDIPPVRPQTAPTGGSRSVSPPLLVGRDDSSELTHGMSQVICGNPVRALRARRQHGLMSQSVVVLPSSSSPQHSISPTGRGMASSSLQWGLNAVRESEQESFLPDELSVTRTHSQVALEPTVTDQEEGDTLYRQTGHLTNVGKRRLPTPPKPPVQSQNPRPKTVADFRHRRYRKSSVESPRSLSGRPNARGLDDREHSTTNPLYSQTFHSLPIHTHTHQSRYNND